MHLSAAVSSGKYLGKIVVFIIGNGHHAVADDSITCIEDNLFHIEKVPFY